VRSPQSLAAALFFLAAGAVLPAQVLTFRYEHPQLSPSQYTLRLRPDGSGHFSSVAGIPAAGDGRTLTPLAVEQDLEVSAGFAAQAFAVARERDYFQFPCESGSKVAFQGTKTLGYEGPEASASCRFNWSRDAKISRLAENMMALGNTMLAGSRLRQRLDHDPLGVDEEMETLAAALARGQAVEVEAIAPVLKAVAGDERLVDRARRRARALLAGSGRAAAAP
jgi:hypothetical protein